jgi:hypothetical protein
MDAVISDQVLIIDVIIWLLLIMLIASALTPMAR